MQALSAPVQRMEAWTILWWSSWRESPSPSASAIRCMKSRARCRLCTALFALLLALVRLSPHLVKRTHQPATTTIRHVMVR
jgi:hypothetical protein